MQQAVSLHESGRLEEAAKIYLEISAQDPQDFDATHLLGVVALQLGRFETAQRLIHKALVINPNDASAMGNLGTSYMRDGQMEAALLWFNMALKLQPRSPVALFNVATALHALGRYQNAIILLRDAYTADRGSFAINNLLGACLMGTGEVVEAVEFFELATLVEPERAEGWANLSAALSAVGRHDDARDSAERGAALNPGSSAVPAALEGVSKGPPDVSSPSAQTLFSLANTLLASGLNDEAIEQFQHIAQRDPHNLTARWAAAVAHLRPLYRTIAEIEASRQAFATAMDNVDRWYRSTTSVFEPYNAVGVFQPFFLAYQPFNNRSLLTRYGELCATWMTTMPSAVAKPDARVTVAGATSTSIKPRIGIVSAHINEHSVWYAITKGWVENIDQTRFNITLFHLGQVTDDETKRARVTVADFEDRPTNVSEWVESIRGKHLDVLIYPEVGMHPLTLQLAALRLAPIQATTWGHPETSGLPTMDIYFSAEALEPEDALDNYSETLVKLPNMGVFVEPLSPVVVDIDLHSLDLPGDEPLLLCPGSPFKYSPIYDHVWIEMAKKLQKRLFRKASGGRLVFFRNRSDIMNRTVEGRLRAEFDKARVDFDKHVSIIPTLDRPRFFGLMRKSALMLDTLGFSGFNTALQAIECDLPVLAFEGEFMRGRLASGLMRRLNLPDLIAQTPDEFVQKAIDLAGNAPKRATLRAEIIARRPMLFNDVAPVRALEQHLIDAMQNRSIRA